MTSPAMDLRGGRPSINPWIVACAVVIPTFMEVLDTTIANVALRYIAGGLSAPASESEWVITSYLAANATILPISGWLSARLGRRNYFLLSIALFTFASALCGMSSSLNMLIVARVLQGLAGGGLQPVSQAILLDAFPPHRQGTGMTLFGIAALLAPIVGPTLGGYITDNYGWQWIFYLNIPVGIVAFFFSRAVVTDPPHILVERERIRRTHRFDLIGLILLSLTMLSWEIVLTKGQEWDWLGDPFHRFHFTAAVFVVCLIGLIYRETHFVNPLINFRTLADRNFRSCCIIMFFAFGMLYANTTTLPGFLQSLFDYDATTSGMVLSPAGIFAVVTLFSVGLMLGKGVDARYLIAVGLLVAAVGSYWMSQFTLQISPWNVVWPRAVIIMGLSMIFAPLNVAAFQKIPPHLRGAAVGLLALLRNEGGSVGTSVAKTMLERREQFHSARLNDGLDPLHPMLSQYLAQGREFYNQYFGDASAAGQAALQTLLQVRTKQALSMAYLDVFWGSAVVAAGLVLLLPLLRRSVAPKGEHIAAE
jgi:DHA2 family multidrug resistance protein